MTRANEIAAPGGCFSRGASLILAGFVALALAGCETGSVFGTAGPSASTAEAPAEISRSSIAFAPIIGAPSKVSRGLEKRLASAVKQQQVPVAASEGDSPDYTVRGYVVAAPDQKGTKLSYIWDVTDGDGKRAHRITGEEIVAGAKSKNPWDDVNDQVLQKIADKTATKLASWVPRKDNGTGEAPSATGAPATGGNVPVASAEQAVSKPAKDAQQAVAQKERKASVQNASLKPTSASQVMAVVPAVNGAPGDGSKALSAALKRKLSANGVLVASEKVRAAYRINGNVALTPPKGGKQEVRIEWEVQDPAGKRVGTVSQKNTIPQGSLDGNWGRTADAAASAAAKGILKLLPESRAVN